MWIARDDDGCYNAFIVKPRRYTGFFSNYWTTMPCKPIWKNIPYVFINLLDDRIKNMTWEDEAIEVEFYIPDSNIDEAAKQYQKKIEENNPTAEAFGFDAAFRAGAEYIIKQIKV